MALRDLDTNDAVFETPQIEIMPKRVTLVEVNVYDRMVPLVSGYLQAYACADTALQKEFLFDKYTTTRDTSSADIAKALAGHSADIYAFSCYLWNIGLVKTLLRLLMEARPEARFLLGGPQVMDHASDVLSPPSERMFVCNGEGERTFANFLRASTEARPDYAGVRGLSFYRDGTLVTTEREDRTHELDEIPSPYQLGLFDDIYHIGVIETNRGCPFRCGFCFWGAATNDKVVKFSADRILADISWISRKQIPFLYLADANWGMLKRDIGISEHIAKCKKNHRNPVFVYFSAAKNSPRRVTEITKIFKSVDLLNAQPISMQSLSAVSLDRVDRTNIKLSAYEALQSGLNEQKMSSFIELIWPLPGETLDSFKDGIQSLCERRAAYIVAYPHLLLHNTPLRDNRQEHGFVTRSVHDGVAEAEIVVETTDVTNAEFEAGMWFFYGVLALYNNRTLPRTSAYLHATGLMTFADLYTGFIAFCRDNPENLFSRFCETSIANADYYDIFNYPRVFHIVGHSEREAFSELLHRFVSTQGWWRDDQARASYELDMLERPFIYSNTPIAEPTFVDRMGIVDVDDRSYIVDVPREWVSLIGDDIHAIGDGDDCRFRVDHRRAQRPFASNDDRQVGNYCNGVIMRIETILPTWTQLDSASDT